MSKCQDLFAGLMVGASVAVNKAKNAAPTTREKLRSDIMLVSSARDKAIPIAIEPERQRASKPFWRPHQPRGTIIQGWLCVTREFLRSMTPHMPRSEPEIRSATNLLALFVRAMALGVFCAGLLLCDPEIDLASISSIRGHWLARLIFLLSIGISFGLGSTLAKVL